MGRASGAHIRSRCPVCPIFGGRDGGSLRIVRPLPRIEPALHNVGRATPMLSYTVRYLGVLYTIGDIVGTLVHLCKRENVGTRSYVCLDWLLVCVHHHRVVAGPGIGGTHYRILFGHLWSTHLIDGDYSWQDGSVGKEPLFL